MIIARFVFVIPSAARNLNLINEPSNNIENTRVIVTATFHAETETARKTYK